MTSVAIVEASDPIPYSGRPAVGSQEGADRSLEAKVRSVHQAVEMVYHIDRELLRHPTRGRSRVAFARQVAMYLAHVTFGLTLTTVGRAFGRDRTTVAHACALVEDARDDPEFDHTLELLEAIARRLASIDAAHPGLPVE